MTNRKTEMFMAGWYRALNISLTIKMKLDRAQASRSDTRLDFSRPGLRYGLSPHRQEISDRRSWFDRLIFHCLAYRERRRYNKVNSSEWLVRMSQRTRKLNDLTTLQLDANRAALVQQMRHVASSASVLDDALAHVFVAVERSRGLVARSNQCLAARAMLDGHCVELATGEGKTLSVALAAGAAALNGTPVHVLTSNDYLAERDATYLEPVYQFLGLQVASVVSNQKPAERRLAYTANIVYVTAKQVAFDWLNDALEWGLEPDSLTARLAVLTGTTSRAAYKPMLRGLCLAIADEADSLLVDEARIPLVLAMAQPGGAAEDTEAAVALGLAEQLREGVDYSVLPSTPVVQLTDRGRHDLSKISQNVAHVWQSSRYREERVEQALTALYRFERDRDYIVRNGRLELMDAHTGRAMPDRRLPHGMHRLLELKEKCKPSPQHETIATVPFQRFFRRYIGLVGISGTLDEVAGEVHYVYDRFVVQVPPHRPCLRTDISAEVFLDRSTQLQAMMKDVQRRQEFEQPVLVCTRSVEQSIGVSAMLTAHGLQHQVLNAYQDASEAAIVATAGQAGQITVATNMAGRGTDIPLGEKITELGGLHVISLAFNDARRLDRQLAGRTARQGDPGSWQQFSSLDDPYLIKAMSPVIRQCACICVQRGWQRAANMLIHWVQKRTESKHRIERLALYQCTERLERKLAFGGKQEQIS